MLWDEAFRPFIEQSPVSVMFRGTLENVLSHERMDRLFVAHAQQQYDHRLAFSCCVEMLGVVVLQSRPSLNAVYRAKREKMAVSVQAVYDKVAGVEPQVSEALVRETSTELAQVVDAMGSAAPGPLPGYDCRIVDGNHLQGTQHRLKELRRMGDAALPGHTVAVLDPQRELIEDVLVCEDGHANQKPLYRRLFEKIQPEQCWIGDRDFCTLEVLHGVQQRRAYFVIRQHSQLQPTPQGARRRIGRTETGMVFEQDVSVTYQGRTLSLRRITIELDKPTRDKQTEIHLLTNLPAKVDGRQIACAYLGRWQIEAAFHKLTTVLRCELNTLGYPAAALFGFCLAVVMFNAVSTVLSALRQVHSPSNVKRSGQKKPRSAPPKFSFYYVADEIAGVWRGMEIVVPADRWTAAFARLSPAQLARKLIWLAQHANPERLWVNPSRVKKRKARRIIQHGGHVSTHRLLQESKPTKSRQHGKL
jgi:hypothetical protein